MIIYLEPLSARELHFTFFFFASCESLGMRTFHAFFSVDLSNNLLKIQADSCQLFLDISRYLKSTVSEIFRWTKFNQKKKRHVLLFSEIPLFSFRSTFVSLSKSKPLIFVWLKNVNSRTKKTWSFKLHKEKEFRNQKKKWVVEFMFEANLKLVLSQCTFERKKLQHVLMCFWCCFCNSTMVLNGRWFCLLNWHNRTKKHDDA